MSVSPLDMTQTQSKMQAQGVELQQRTLGNLQSSNMSDAEKSEKLREACEGFESIFIQKMWQQMRATVPQENPLVGREEKFWQSMYDQELSKKMASAGGIGLAEMMYEQLSRNLVSASSNTASAASATTGTNGNFAIDAVPLIPQRDIPPMASTQHNTDENNTHNATAASIYDGAAPYTGPANTTNTGTAPTLTGNATPVQQYMLGLQQKQAGMNAYNGLAQSQNVAFQIGSEANGAVLPQTPHVVRTTYTTNIPQNAGKRGEEVHREVVRELQSPTSNQPANQIPNQIPGQLAGQVAAVNNMYNGNAPVLTAQPMNTVPTTGAQPIPAPLAPADGIVPTAAPLLPQSPAPVLTPTQSTNTPEQAPVSDTPTANAIRPILPAGAVVAPSMAPGNVGMAPYDPVRPYTPTGTQRKVEDSSGA